MPHSLSRRAVLSLIGTALAAPARAQGEGLADIAARAGILFGASIATEGVTDPAYGRLYEAETRIVTTDWALKFDNLRPDPERFEFGDADAILAFARPHGLQVRGHTLIWNDAAPAWLKRLPRREVERVFDSHIDIVAGRYAGRLHSWDVVNEPFWPDSRAPGGYRRGPWYDAMGPDYVARAFRRTAAADPAARLVLNEAFTERDDGLGRTVRQGLLRLVAELRDAGVPLHAVGLQAHLQPQHPADDDAFVAFLHALAGFGLDIYLTELDVDDTGFPDDIAIRDRMVAERYGTFLQRALSVPAVKVVITWQLADRFSWYASPEILRERRTHRLPRPLPFDAALRPKPAREAIARALRERG